MKDSFGEIVYKCRQRNEWTVEQFIKILGEDLSPSYITKIELHGEIPRPELICKISSVLGLDKRAMLEMAKNSKIQQFTAKIDKKYRKFMLFILLMLCYSCTLWCNQHKKDQLWLHIEQIDKEILETARKRAENFQNLTEKLLKLDEKKQKLHDELKKLYK